MADGVDEGSRWWWCIRHARPEQDGARCAAKDLMGPYASEAQARAWRDRSEARNEAWEEADDAWESR